MIRRVPRAGSAGLAAAAALSALALVRPAIALPAPAPAPSPGLQHLVVIYEENHSFDNLYGLWPGVNGLASPPASTPNSVQVDQTGTAYSCLKQNDSHLTTPPLPATCTDPRGFTSAFPNQPFPLDPYVSQTSVTEDLVHRYYQEGYQIDGGKMDRFTTGSDAAGLTMGYWDTTKLPVYQYLTGAGAPHFQVADNFFHAALGGSFLNHQWLIAAQTPVFSGALNDGSANDLHSVVDTNGMPANTPLYTSPLGGAVKDKALTASCTPPAGRPATPTGTVCGDYAVNTIQPASQPYSPTSSPAQRLPLLHSTNIGDELSAKGISWGWYAGGWDNAAGNTSGPGWTNGTTPGTCTDPAHNPADTYPYCGDSLFQYHHQPFNYYANYAPGTPGRSHLQDETAFLAQAGAGTLPAVSYVKPMGPENEHPGYTDINSGEQHLVNLIKAIQAGPDASSTAIVVTYDEHGGSWDGVPPPTGSGVSDQWGPGVRVPTLIISNLLPSSGVLHRPLDTTAILALIEQRWGVAPLGTRDAAYAGMAELFPTAPVPTLHPVTFANAPAGASKPDDITQLGDTLYVPYQNNAGADGTPAGATSTVVGFDPSGAVSGSWVLPGRVDGLTADPLRNRLIATVNEDLNSSLYTISPGAVTPIQHYTYSPSPAQTGTDGTNGGTDAISVSGDGTIYVAHSNPDLTQAPPNNPPADYRVTLSGSTATLTPVFGVNDTAAVINPKGGPAAAPLGLTDPDSNRYVPDNGGSLIQVGQADSKIAVASHIDAGPPSLSQLLLSNATVPVSGTAATTPQLDDVVRVTGPGTLYAVDQGSGTIYAYNTDNVTPGTWFASQPKPASGDLPNDPALAVFDPTTGVVTHVDTTMKSPKGLLFVATPPLPQGYWEVASDGGIFNFGNAGFFGSQGGSPLNRPMVGMARTPDAKGYWEVASDGGIFTHGDAGFFGSHGGAPLNSPIVGMAATPDGMGYWLVAADGGIFSYGDAGFFGSHGGAPLNSPVVGMAATLDGMGYWLVAADGGIFNYGDAQFFGSHGGAPLNKPIVGMAARPDGQGYWLVASDGGIFSYGSAGFFGSHGGAPLNAPVVGLATTPDGMGYWEAAADGGIFNYGDAAFLGSMGGTTLTQPVVGMAS